MDSQGSSDKFCSKKRQSINRESEKQVFYEKQEDKFMITDLK